MENNNQEVFHKTSINWYPGHMAKTRRLIKENINMVDVIYEVVDARIPFSSRIKDIDDLISNKPRIIIMTKTDLCDINKTSKCAKAYEKMGFKVVMVDLINNKGISDIYNVTSILLKDLDDKRESKGLKKRAYRALIVGIPNVGKSTLINRLVGKKATITGDKPGVTKSKQWVRLKGNLELLDTPGILWPKFEDQEVALNLAFSRAIKDEILDIDTLGLKFIEKLMEIEPEKLMARYKLENLGETPLETMEMIGRKRGFILGRQELDYTRIALTVLNEYREGKIGQISLEEPADYMA